MGRGLDHQAIADWAGQLAMLQQQGTEVIVVSSGAVAEGKARMGINQRPEDLPGLQACAAIGQMGLVQAWSSALDFEHGVHTAQVLLTHDDLTGPPPLPECR